MNVRIDIHRLNLYVILGAATITIVTPKILIGGFLIYLSEPILLIHGSLMMHLGFLLAD